MCLQRRKGNIQGRCGLITGVASSSSPQASTDHGGLCLQCHDPVQHSQLHWRPREKPFCFSRNSSCSPCKVFSIWWLAAVTCYAAHLPCADADGLIRWAQNAYHPENPELLQLSMQTVSLYGKAAPFISPSSSLGYLFGMEISVLRGLRDRVSDMFGLKVCTEQVNGV